MVAVGAHAVEVLLGQDNVVLNHEERVAIALGEHGADCTLGAVDTGISYFIEITKILLEGADRPGTAPDTHRWEQRLNVLETPTVVGGEAPVVYRDWLTRHWHSLFGYSGTTL